MAPPVSFGFLIVSWDNRRNQSPSILLGSWSFTEGIFLAGKLIASKVMGLDSALFSDLFSFVGPHSMLCSVSVGPCLDFVGIGGSDTAKERSRQCDLVA